MELVVGPLLTRQGGYAFDTWEPHSGFRPGFTYRRMEDARYARNVVITERTGAPSGPVVCMTLDEFMGEARERGALRQAA